VIPVVLGLGGLIAKVAAAAVVPRAVKALAAILSGPAQPDARRPGPDLVEPVPPSTTMTAPQRAAETGLIRKQAIAHNDDFGETTQTSGSATVYNPFLYTGQELDKETGFYHLRARHYAPSLGKFLSRDPIGYAGGSNLYSYCAGDSINFTDPSGLEPPPWVNAWLNTLDVTATAAGAYYGGQAGGATGFTIGAGAGLSTGPGATVASPALATAGAAIGTVAGAAAGGTAAHAGAQIVGGLVRGAYGMFSEGANGESTGGGNPGKPPCPPNRKAIRSLEKQIREHEKKIADYLADPGSLDAKGWLKNVSPALRDKIVNGRVQGLRNSIKTYQENIRKILSGELKS